VHVAPASVGSEEVYNKLICLQGSRVKDGSEHGPNNGRT
jgi:hypothetical protein